MAPSLTWSGKFIDELDTVSVAAKMAHDGFCLIKSESIEESALTTLCSAIGSIQFHQRSEHNGVTFISSDPTTAFDPDLFQGLSDQAIAPHSDGAYLEMPYLDANGVSRWVIPPAIIALQCVSPASAGGESILIDGQKMYDAIISDNEMYRYTTYCAFEFTRASYTTFSVPMYRLCRNGNFTFRFRGNYNDLTNSRSVGQNLADRFVRDFLSQKVYQRRILLQAGDILLVDNFRMLHARTAFRNSPGRFRQFRRLWIADRWGNVGAPSDQFAADEPWGSERDLGLPSFQSPKIWAYRSSEADSLERSEGFRIKVFPGVRLAAQRAY